MSSWYRRLFVCKLFNPIRSIQGIALVGLLEEICKRIYSSGAFFCASSSVMTMSFFGIGETELLRLPIDQHGFLSGLKHPLDLLTRGYR